MSTGLTLLMQIVGAVVGGGALVALIQALAARGPDLRKELWARVTGLENRILELEKQNATLREENARLSGTAVLQTYQIEQMTGRGIKQEIEITELRADLKRVTKERDDLADRFDDLVNLLRIKGISLDGLESIIKPKGA